MPTHEELSAGAQAGASGSFDVVVIGGGINGAGIARDAAGRGLRVLICERDDLAAHTSSASTKLIHGGLRYLEHHDYALVRKSLQEREVLLAAAPHIIWPLRFVMPHDTHLRPAWMIRAGLFLYDHLARRRRLEGSRAVDLRRHEAGAPLDPRYRRGFVYSDAWVDDARLVVLNAMDAAAHGASIHTRTRFVQAREHEPRNGLAGRGWTVELEANGVGGLSGLVHARCLVNAAGPWVGRVHDAALQSRASRQVRLVKGSHVIVPRLFAHEYAYLFQNPDRRIIFAIPYEREFTLIGTTDVEHACVDDAARIDVGEVEYLCEMANRYFRSDISAAQVVASYSGLRPLLDDESADPSSITRDYSLELARAGAAPLLSIFGGKITTYRRLAEEAVDAIVAALGDAAPAGARRRWTRGVPLPGGDLPDADFASFEKSLALRHPWLAPAQRSRYARLYGSRALRWLGDADSTCALGEELMPGLFEAEVRYLCEHEYARESSDILWRRTKLGLHLRSASTQALEAWLADRKGSGALS